MIGAVVVVTTSVKSVEEKYVYVVHDIGSVHIGKSGKMLH